MCEIRFTLSDAWGQEHEYITEEFSVDETADLHPEVMPILAGPVVEIFGAMMSGAKPEEKEGESAAAGGGLAAALNAPGGLLAALARVDWSQVSGAVLLLPKLIKEAAPHGKASLLYARILAKTSRVTSQPTAEGESGGEVDVPFSLAIAPNRDHVYGGGNIIELYKAVLCVLFAHFGPFGRSGLPLSKELSGALMSLLPIQPNNQSETAAQSGAGSSGSAKPPS